MLEDHGSTRIDLACPACRQLFKVRLRKLQFGADLTCRLCRHEFSAQEVSDRPEVREALARMHGIAVTQRVCIVKTKRGSDITEGRDDEKRDYSQGNERKKTRYSPFGAPAARRWS